jgi:cytochrome b pre-mRNA-processing protein 3
MILGLFRKDPRRELVVNLHDRIVAAARAPALYGRLGASDTLEGRFETLALHAVLVLRRLRGLPPPADDLAQDLVDALFGGLDASLRQIGVGDMAVPKRMKKLAQAFYGRAGAYDGALDARDEPALVAALARNVTGDEGPARALARYVLAAERSLAGQDLADLVTSGPAFPDPESAAQERSP